MLRQDTKVAVERVLRELQQAQVTAALCLEHLIKLIGLEVGPDTAPGGSAPFADDETFCIVWHGNRCPLGHTKLFALFCRLLRRANRFVGHDQLLHDVWHGDRRSPQTIRSAVRNLKMKLGRAGMGDLAAAIRSECGHYGLMLRSYD
jgi:hypothetical protein